MGDMPLSGIDTFLLSAALVPAVRGWCSNHCVQGARCAARTAIPTHQPLAGVNGMGIPLGKIQLYVAGGGFHPEHSLPAIIDNGTNTKSNIEDKFYFVRAPRVPLQEDLGEQQWSLSFAHASGWNSAAASAAQENRCTVLEDMTYQLFSMPHASDKAFAGH